MSAGVENDRKKREAQIRDIAKRRYRQPIDPAAAYLDVLDAAETVEERYDLCTLILAEHGQGKRDLRFTDVSRAVSDAEWREYVPVLRGYMDGLTRRMLAGNASPRDTARFVWDRLSGLDMSTARVVALALLLDSRAVPYGPRPDELLAGVDYQALEAAEETGELHMVVAQARRIAMEVSDASARHHGYAELFLSLASRAHGTAFFGHVVALEVERAATLAEGKHAPVMFSIGTGSGDPPNVYTGLEAARPPYSVPPSSVN